MNSPPDSIDPRPRCSHTDRLGSMPLIVPGAVPWEGGVVHWCLAAVPNGVTEDRLRAAFQAACDAWAAVADLTFSETDRHSQANVIVTAQSIDGAMGILGETEIPMRGMRAVHLTLDSDESWVPQIPVKNLDAALAAVLTNWDRPVGYDEWPVSSRGGINLYDVILHELGHALGLGHTVDGGHSCVMDPFYNTAITKPQPGDVVLIQQLYGPPKPKAPAVPIPTPPGESGPIVIRIVGAQSIEVVGYRVTKI